MATKSKRAYLKAVRSKLRESRDILLHGPMGPVHGHIRNEQGLDQTFSNLINVAENNFDLWSNSGNISDPVADTCQNFSVGSGYADVTSAATVGAIDVSILVQANSLVPFLAIDRSMANPNDTVYYSQVFAQNSAGGLTAGALAQDNFSPPNSSINLGPNVAQGSQTGNSTTATSGTTISLSAYLLPGTVSVAIQVGSVTYTGGDFGGTGTIYFSGIATTASVVYSTGTVTLSSLASGSVATVTGTMDVTIDDTGANILKVKNELVSLPLVSLPKQIILSQNAQALAYANKIARVAASVQAGGDYTNLHFAKISNIYIEDINRDLIKQVVLMATFATPIVLDFTSYGTSSFNATKDDLVNRFIINLRANFLKNTNMPATVIITGTKGCAELESNQLKWVPSPTFYDQLNGLAGTFGGVPVFRHNYLDSIEGANQAHFYLASKLPDNTCGSLVFGEFVGLTQTATVGNAANPLMNSTGFFSQVGNSVISNKLVTFGYISYGSNP